AAAAPRGGPAGTPPPPGPAATSIRPTTPGPDARNNWRRWRGTAAVGALVLLGGLIVALLHVRPPVTGVLDPNDTGPARAHDLVALLAGRGQREIDASAGLQALPHTLLRPVTPQTTHELLGPHP